MDRTNEALVRHLEDDHGLDTNTIEPGTEEDHHIAEHEHEWPQCMACGQTIHPHAVATIDPYIVCEPCKEQAEAWSELSDAEQGDLILAWVDATKP